MKLHLARRTRRTEWLAAARQQRRRVSTLPHCAAHTSRASVGSSCAPLVALTCATQTPRLLPCSPYAPLRFAGLSAACLARAANDHKKHANGPNITQCVPLGDPATRGGRPGSPAAAPGATEQGYGTAPAKPGKEPEMHACLNPQPMRAGESGLGAVAEAGLFQHPRASALEQDKFDFL